MEDEAVNLTKILTPIYPLGYIEVYIIVLSYITECEKLGVKYNPDELDRRIRNYVMRGV